MLDLYLASNVNPMLGGAQHYFCGDCKVPSSLQGLLGPQILNRFLVWTCSCYETHTTVLSYVSSNFTARPETLVLYRTPWTASATGALSSHHQPDSIVTEFLLYAKACSWPR